MEEGNKILNNSLCLLYEICSRVEDLGSENTIRIENCVDQTQDEESTSRKYVFSLEFGSLSGKLFSESDGNLLRLAVVNVEKNLTVGSGF